MSTGINVKSLPFILTPEVKKMLIKNIEENNPKIKNQRGE